VSNEILETAFVLGPDKRYLELGALVIVQRQVVRREQYIGVMGS
jgi:hypothetical protein